MIENSKIFSIRTVNPAPRKRLAVTAPPRDVKTSNDKTILRPRKVVFKKSDVWRAISAAQKGGVTVSGMEISDNGSIRLKFATANSTDSDQIDRDQFDEWKNRL